MAQRKSVELLIIGCGFGGIGAAIYAKRSGITSMAILDKGSDIGGTWRDNAYPGAACDIASTLYSFSFEMNPRWSRTYPEQPEILAYLRHCVDKYALRPHLHLHSEVETARFDAERGRWSVRTVDGTEWDARAVISAVGQLNRPFTPMIPGLKTFTGPQFHSARWRDDVSLRGRSVAVIGSGASAIQLIPRVADEARELMVFQRSAPYVVTKRDVRYSALTRALWTHVPAAQRVSRLGYYLNREFHGIPFFTMPRMGDYFLNKWQRRLRREVPDPQLRAALTPDYPMGCKRIVISNEYYRTLQRPNVDLVTSPISGVEAQGIRTEDGALRRVDAIIFATGFKSTEFLSPMQIIGREGLELNDVWRGEPEAYLGTTVSGFPNFFMLYGPNTNLGHNSIVYMLERQIRYVMQALELLGQAPHASLEVRDTVQRRFNDEMQQTLSKSVWATGCRSWYTTDAGKVVNNWSSYTFDFARRTRRFDVSDYVVSDARHSASSAREPAPAT